MIISQDGNETNSSPRAGAVSVSSCEIRGAEITERGAGGGGGTSVNR